MFHWQLGYLSPGVLMQKVLPWGCDGSGYSGAVNDG